MKMANADESAMLCQAAHQRFRELATPSSVREYVRRLL
jgi:hypothetical protein